MGLLEGLLQLLQLAAGEDRPAMPPLVLLLAPGARAAGTDEHITAMGAQQATGIATSTAGGTEEGRRLGMMDMGMGGVGGMGVHMSMGMGMGLGVGMMGVVGGGRGSGMMMSGSCSSCGMLMGGQSGGVMRTGGR